jgi:hypothetical protein
MPPFVVRLPPLKPSSRRNGGLRADLDAPGWLSRGAVGSEQAHDQHAGSDKV